MGLLNRAKTIELSPFLSHMCSWGQSPQWSKVQTWTISSLIKQILYRRGVSTGKNKHGASVACEASLFCCVYVKMFTKWTRFPALLWNNNTENNVWLGASDETSCVFHRVDYFRCIWAATKEGFWMPFVLTSRAQRTEENRKYWHSRSWALIFGVKFSLFWNNCSKCTRSESTSRCA